MELIVHSDLNHIPFWSIEDCGFQIVGCSNSWVDPTAGMIFKALASITINDHAVRIQPERLCYLNIYLG